MSTKYISTLFLLLVFLWSNTPLAQAQTSIDCGKDEFISEDLNEVCIPESLAGTTLAAAISYYQNTYIIDRVLPTIGVSCNTDVCNTPGETCEPYFNRWGYNSSPFNSSTVKHDTTNNKWCFPKTTKNYSIGCTKCEIPDTTTTGEPPTGGTTDPAGGGTEPGGTTEPGTGGTTEPGTSVDEPTIGGHTGEEPPVIDNPLHNPSGQEGQIQVFPQPAAQQANVSIHLAKATQNAHWTITDLSGRQHVKEALYELPKGDSIRPLAVEQLAPGIYFLSLFVDHQQISTTKLIIN